MKMKPTKLDEATSNHLLTWTDKQFPDQSLMVAKIMEDFLNQQDAVDLRYWLALGWGNIYYAAIETNQI